MKWLTIGILLNFFVAAPVLSELTKEDLQAIRAIVKEEIAESEARTDLKLQLLTTRIDEMDKRLTASIANVDKGLTSSSGNVDKRLGFLQALVLVLVTAVIGVPVGIFFYFERRIAKRNKESQGGDSSDPREIFTYLGEILTSRNAMINPRAGKTE